jgi:uncharacterized protein (TIGR03067 family)
MQRNVVVAARWLGASLVLASTILVCGLHWVMSTHRCSVTASPASATVAGGPATDPPKTPGSDQEMIQGTWRLVEYEDGSMKVGEGTAIPAKLTLTMSGDEIRINNAGSTSVGPRFELHPEHGPKHIDFTYSAREVRPGIYKFEGPRLWLCWLAGDGKRPVEFRATKPANPAVYVFERMPTHRHAVAAPASHGDAQEVRDQVGAPRPSSAEAVLAGPGSDLLQLRIEQLNQSEDLRQIEYEWERLWFTDNPSHLTPERIHGGVQ